MDVDPRDEKVNRPSSIATRKKQVQALKRKLLATTNENTMLLKEIAELKAQHIKLNEDIKTASCSHSDTRASRVGKEDVASEKAKLLAVANRQEQEIEMLKLEIKSYKTKCGKQR